MSTATAAVGDRDDARHSRSRAFVLSKKFLIPACLSILFTSTGVVLWLMRPAPAYEISGAPDLDLGSRRFDADLAALADGNLHPRTAVELFVGGPAFYAAELDAIERATETVNLERYIFQTGGIGDRYLDALTRAAARGVEVKVLVDAVGSKALSKGDFEAFEAAGGEVAFYHPLHWWNIDRLNNRTHRNLLIVDGRTGFTGGAGVAAFWHRDTDGGPRWDDMMVRLEGDAVASLQSVFAENWVEATGELIAADRYFRQPGPVGDTPAIVIDSTPSSGGSTRTRMTFQTLFASAKARIWIQTPYFIPDRGVREELIRAVRERGVDVRVIVPGQHSDQPLVRSTGRHHYAPLIDGGVRIFEHRPRMMHRKALLIDGLWTVVGTTNLDPRSFALNDEVNVALRSRALTGDLERDFESAQQASREWRREDLAQRGIVDRATGWFGLLFQRQQ